MKKFYVEFEKKTSDQFRIEIQPEFRRRAQLIDTP